MNGILDEEEYTEIVNYFREYRRKNSTTLEKFENKLNNPSTLHIEIIAQLIDSVEVIDLKFIRRFVDRHEEELRDHINHELHIDKGNGSVLTNFHIIERISCTRNYELIKMFISRFENDIKDTESRRRIQKLYSFSMICTDSENSLRALAKLGFINTFERGWIMNLSFKPFGKNLDIFLASRRCKDYPAPDPIEHPQWLVTYLETPEKTRRELRRKLNYCDEEMEDAASLFVTLMFISDNFLRIKQTE